MMVGPRVLNIKTISHYLERVYHFLWPDGTCHGSSSRWGNDVSYDIVFCALNRKRARQADNSGLRCGVLGETITNF
jgi:hypothetical protein